jgi:hypothetical protein
MNITLKKELKDKWRKYQEDNPNLKRTFAHHHYIRTRYAAKFWLNEIKLLTPTTTK